MRILSIPSSFLFVLLLLGCGFPRSAPAVVKIGLIAPFEGPSRPLGYATLHAVRLRLNEWNESDGLPRIELVALNDDGDPALSASLAAQLAIDPDILIVLGPPQSHTAREAVPALAARGLPVISLAALPEDDPGIAPWGGLVADVQTALAPYNADVTTATPAWSAPLSGPAIWFGPPLPLAEILATAPENIVGAGSVAAEDAFRAWAGPNAAGLLWAAPLPDDLPPRFVGAYTEFAGASPKPIAFLAYAATDRALFLLNRHADRDELIQAVDGLTSPPMQAFLEEEDACCIPLTTPSPP
ncbi:MAG: ABC transporter substrate-binding protein [Chloroflexi bacterium]|nr:ABC transporter substrate-binding protein [Chloroflexota bacterium]